MQAGGNAIPRKGFRVKREYLVKQIAATGYDILYSAKKHFATFDIVAKVPGWITIITLTVGVLALAVPAFNNVVLGVATIAVGIGSIFFGTFQDERSKYADAGGQLLSHYYALRTLYYEVQSRDESESTADLEAKYHEIFSQSQKVWLHKHIFISDWYAHYKIFWQSQIEWLDEQLNFTLFRDKLPLSFTATVALGFIGFAVWIWSRYSYALPGVDS